MLTMPMPKLLSEDTSKIQIDKEEGARRGFLGEQLPHFQSVGPRMALFNLGGTGLVWLPST